MKIPIIDRIRHRKLNYLPPSIPKELKDKLNHHGNPLAWWIGQLSHFLMRLNENLEFKIKKFERKINFKTPCVGYKTIKPAFNFSNKIYFKFLEFTSGVVIK